MAFDLLMEAIRNGNKEQLGYIYLTESCNNRDFTFNTTSNQTTPLCLAASLNNVEIVNLLLWHGASVNYKIEDNSKTPLHFACDKEYVCSDNTSIVRELISSGADINVQDDEGQAPIHFACTSENMEIIECLLENNVDVDVADIDDETPLVRACYAQNFELMKLLVNYGCRFDYPNNVPLSMCVSRGNIPAVKFLLDIGEDIHKKEYLSSACEFNHLDMMDFLYTLGIDVNKRQTSTCFCFTPLLVACLSRSVDYAVVEKLLSWGADVKLTSITGDTALHYAAQQLDVIKVKLLLQYGAPVNIIDSIGMTPLSAALTSILNPALMYCIIELFSAVGCNICWKVEEIVKRHHLDNIEQLNSSVLPLLQTLSKNPLDLKDICRIKIRNTLGRNIQKNLFKLHLPKLLLDYLNLSDVCIPNITL